MNWVKNGSLVGLTASVLLSIVAGAGWTQEEGVIASGKRQYTWYCEFCHGVTGKGDGPMAPNLRVKPADLTQLRKKHEGHFPFWHVYRVIDGREEVRGHGTGAMPIWGQVFKRQEEDRDPYFQEDVVIGRILSLVYYLKFIQEQ